MASLVRPDSVRERSGSLRIGALVRAIAREIRERSSALLLLEAAAEERGASRTAATRRRLREADAAAERRGLELAGQELARLGCTIVAWEPLTIALERDRRKELWMLDGPD